MNWKIWYRPIGSAQWLDGGVFVDRREVSQRVNTLREQGNEAKPEFIGKQRVLAINPKHLGI